MPPFLLRTLDEVRLDGPAGIAPIADPGGLAVLVLVAFSPDGLDEPEALLRLTPELTATAGRARLRALIADIETAAGRPLVEWRGTRLTLDREAVAVDAILGPPTAPPGPDGSRFLGRFELAGSPEFAEWAATIRPRIRAKQQPATNGPSSRPPGRRTSVAVGVGGLIVLIAVYATRASPPPGFSRGDPIVLADVDNTTGDTLFDRSLTTAATVALQQSPQLSLLPAPRIAGALRRMGNPRPDTTHLTIDLAREVAVRENVRYALGLRLESVGDGYRLTARLTNAVSGVTIASGAASAETKAGTLNALDRVLQDVRAGLGEQRSERRAWSVLIPAATTPSLEALKAYASGTAAWSRGSYKIAKEFWERALDLDSGFAMAMGSLGAYHYYMHDRVQGAASYRRALEHVNRLTEWERLRIESGFATGRGDVDSALTIDRVIIDRYPSGTSWYNYGTGLMQRGRYRESIVALKRALQYDSTFGGTYINLATDAKALGDWREALRNYRIAGDRDSTWLARGNIGSEYGNLLLIMGQSEEARAQFRRMIGRIDLFDRTLGFRGLGYTAVLEGRLDEAVGFFRQAAEVSVQQKSPLSTARGRLLEALTLLLVGEKAAANRALDQAIAATTPEIEPSFRGYLGYGLVRAGRQADAERLYQETAALADSANENDRQALILFHADLLMGRNHPDSAASELRRVTSRQLQTMAKLRQMAAQTMAGNVPVVGTLSDSLLVAAAIGAEPQFEWLFGLVEAGDLAAARHDSSAARAYYGRLIELWQRGDSTSVMLGRARRRLAELSPSR